MLILKRIFTYILIVEAILFGYLLYELIQETTKIEYIKEIQYVSKEETQEKEIKNLIAQYDWDQDIAYAVMLAESSASSTVVNWEDSHRGCKGSVGLFQIACIHDSIEKLKDPEYNVKRAYELYSQYGWKPWGAYTNLSYQKHLTLK